MCFILFGIYSQRATWLTQADSSYVASPAPEPSYIYFCWFNVDALALWNAYKPTKEPINYRGPGGDRTHDLQTEATPPAASCSARSLHATEIVSKNTIPNTLATTPTGTVPQQSSNLVHHSWGVLCLDKSSVNLMKSLSNTSTLITITNCNSSALRPDAWKSEKNNSSNPERS